MADDILLYDLDCGFCRWTLAKILAWDRAGRIRPVAIQDPEGQRLVAEVAPEEQLRSWHLRSADGRLYSAGYVVTPLMRLLPGGAPLALLARRFPRGTDAIYRWGASRRSVWGRLLPVAAKERAARRLAARSRAA